MWKLVRMTFSYEKNVLWREDLSPGSPIHARTFHWPRRWVQRLNWSIRPVHTPRDVARIAAVCLALALYGETFDRFHKAEFSLSKWEFPVALCRPRFCLAMLCISAAYAVMRCLSVCLSACPSRSWTVSKRINISSKKNSPSDSQAINFRTKRHGINIPTGTPSPNSEQRRRMHVGYAEIAILSLYLASLCVENRSSGKCNTLSCDAPWQFMSLW